VDFSYAQLEGLWENAGGSVQTAPVAAAVSEAESSGSATATSGNPDGGTNVGLWQLDTPGGVGAGYSVAQLENPATNALVAVKGSADGTNWGDWQTFVQGTYQRFLQSGVPADTNVATPAGGVSAGAGTTSAGGSGFVWYEPWTWLDPTISDTEQAARTITGTVLRFLTSGAVVGAGLALVVWGLARATSGPRQAAAAAAPVLPLAEA
jgi:hypothetical protein